MTPRQQSTRTFHAKRQNEDPEISIKNILALVPPDRKGEKLSRYSFLAEELVEFAKRGIRVHTVSTYVSEQKESDSGTIHPIPATRQLRHTFGAWRQYCRSHSQPFVGVPSWGKRLQLARKHRTIEQVITNENIDIIYSPFAWPSGTAGLAAAQKTETPVVVTMRGVDILTEPSIGYGQTLCRDAKARISYTLNQVDHVIGVSQALVDRAIELGAQRDKTSVILKGVNVDQFHAGSSSVARQAVGLRDVPTVLFVGGLDPVKGVSVLLGAFNLVRRVVNNAQLVICGDGPEFHNIKALASELDIVDRLVMPGKVGRDQIADYFRGSDVFVLPSLTEGSGNVLVEAGACGKPLIGTNWHGIPDYIDDGKTGFLFKKNNSRDLADKLETVLANPGLARSLGGAARRRVEQCFRYDQMIDAILEVFHRVLAQHQSVQFTEEALSHHLV